MKSINDVKVFINGVEIPDVLIGNISINYEKFPGICRCSITLFNYMGVFNYVPKVGLDYVLNKFNKEFVSVVELLSVGREFPQNCPLFFDGDLVWVFVKINDIWWWGFFGYVNGFDLGVQVNSGKETVMLSCEDSLRHFRYGRVVMHELLAPFGIRDDNGDLKEGVKKFLQFSYTPMKDLTQGLGFYDKVRRVFGFKVEGDSENDYVNDVYNPFILNDDKILLWEYDNLKNREDVENKFVEHVKFIFDLVKVGDDLSLDSLVSVLQEEFFANKGLKRKVHLVVFDFKDKNNVFNFLVQELKVGQLNVSHIIGLSRVDMLRMVLETMCYDGYVLPNGDIIIEPYWFGLLSDKKSCIDSGKKVGNDFVFVLDENKLRGLNLGYSGNDIRTIITVKFSLLGDVLPINAVSVLFDKKVSKYGFREAFPSFFTANVVNRDMAKALGYYELLRHWLLVRSVNCSLSSIDVFYFVNKPLYISLFDGVFYVSNVRLEVDSNKNISIGLIAKGGFFNNGKGEYKLECFMNENEKMVVGNVVDLFSKSIDVIDYVDRSGRER